MNGKQQVFKSSSVSMGRTGCQYPVPCFARGCCIVVNEAPQALFGRVVGRAWKGGKT